MGMRETVGSMRAYFFLVGGVVVLAGVYGVANAPDPTMGIFVALVALFGGAFFYAAITLKTAIAYARTKAIEIILYVNIAINVLVSLLALPTSKEKHLVAIRVAITLIIGFYLLANLKRLVKEHAAAAAELAPAPPPPIPAPQSPPEGPGQEQAADGD